MSHMDPPEPTVPVPVIPAGWYPSNGELRFWDGAGWTDDRRPLQAQAFQPQRAAVPYGDSTGYQSGSYTTVLTDARTNPLEVAIAWVLTVLTLGYMLPWAVAATRG